MAITESPFWKGEWFPLNDNFFWLKNGIFSKFSYFLANLCYFLAFFRKNFMKYIESDVLSSFENGLTEVPGYFSSIVME